MLLVIHLDIIVCGNPLKYVYICTWFSRILIFIQLWTCSCSISYFMTTMFQMVPWHFHSFPKLGKIEITIDFNGQFWARRPTFGFRYSQMEWWILFSLYQVITVIISFGHTTSLISFPQCESQLNVNNGYTWCQNS